MTASTSKPPRPRDQMIYCRVKIEGRSLSDLAAEYKISEDRIKFIVRKVRQWLHRGPSCSNLEETSPLPEITLRRIHIARLEHQWDEVMNAWYRSRRPEETDKATLAKDGRKAEKTKRTQTGDVKYLEQARAILAEIRRLAEPSSHEEQERVEYLGFDRRAMELSELLERLGDRARAAEDRRVAAGPLAAAESAGAVLSS